MSEYDDIPTVSRDEVAPGAVILDVREDDEWAKGHIAGAVHVPFDRLPQRMHYEPDELLTDDPIVVVCAGGGSRSTRATAWLNANGFDAVKLDGGTRGWHESGLPMASETDEPPAV
jgi:rhodanese-related sulfurtransferase